VRWRLALKFQRPRGSPSDTQSLKISMFFVSIANGGQLSYRYGLTRNLSGNNAPVLPVGAVQCQS